MHRRLQAHLHQNRNRRLWTTPESTNGRLHGFLMLSCVIGSLTILFKGREIVTYVQAGNRRNTSRMPRSWSTYFTEHIRRSREGNELSFGTRKWRKWVQFRDSRAEEKHQLDDLFCLSLLHFFSYWSGPVQMALARVLPPSDHSQVELEFPRAPDPQNHREICFIFCFHPCMKICSPGALRIERGMM